MKGQRFMATITQRELNERIRQHEEWLKNEAKGNSPSFAGLDLSGLDLKGANLYHSNFKGSCLRGCNFRCSDLGYSELEGADLTEANLKNANLFRANLKQAVLKDVEVNEYTMFYFQVCPEEGGFIGYKKAAAEKGRYALIKLYIPADARRNSATSYRCRADRAKVLEITDEAGQPLEKAWSGRDKGFVYQAGQWLKVPEFDEDRWNEKTKGIHFYLSKEAARLY